MDTITFLYQRKQELQVELEKVNRAITVMGGRNPKVNAAFHDPKPHGRVFSAAAKRKMSQAAKARWAEIKKKKTK